MRFPLDDIRARRKADCSFSGDAPGPEKASGKRPFKVPSPAIRWVVTQSVHSAIRYSPAGKLVFYCIAYVGKLSVFEDEEILFRSHFLKFVGEVWSEVLNYIHMGFYHGDLVGGFLQNGRKTHLCLRYPGRG